jgi:hypothetical protein
MNRMSESRRPFRTLAAPKRALLGACIAMSLLAAALPAISSGASDSTAVALPGTPLTVDVGPRGQCQSSYLVNGEVASNYFPGGSQVGDCGFFLAFPAAGAGQPTALQGQTFGFEGNAGPRLTEAYTPISQSAVTGAGTEASPYSETTVFEVVDSGASKDALITETTTYVNGAPQFTSTYTVKNTSGSKLYFRAIYAGDLYVNGNDQGIGVFFAGPPRFIGGQNTGSGIVGGFQEVTGSGLLPWSAFQEAYWSNPLGTEGIAVGDNGIWNDVETTDEEAHAFNESLEPKELDNGAGVEWDQLRTAGLASGEEQSFTIINRTQIPSALQISPASQTLTQGQTETVTVTAVDTAHQPYAGKTLRYTVAGGNPQSGAVTLNASGQAQISYVGKNPGIDTIQMFLDLSGSGSQTANDPSGTATVTFVPTPPAPNSTYTVQSIHANGDGTVTIVFVPTQAGTASVVVTVPTATIASRASAAKHKRCKKGQVKIKGKCRPASTVTGKVTTKGLAGVALKITVKPSSKVKRLLKKGKTVVLTATLTYTSALGGKPTVQTFHVKVKGKRHH